MKIIAIEGLDKSGKATQTALLTERLRLEGYNVVQSEFHRYDTPTGQLIQKWLRKEWDVDQKTIELIMAADKQAQQQWFEELEFQGVDFLVLDRYTGSQFVYGQATGTDVNHIGQLLRFVRRPDLEILIDITPEESMKRKGKWGDNDRYESDKALLTAVRYLYVNKPGIVKVDGMRNIEEIHQDIWQKVEERFSLPWPKVKGDIHDISA
jgi:dTMP kinase